MRSRGIDHLVLERRSVGYAWRERRWDSFCLVTPNWQCRLPGFPYRGKDPDGFMSRDEIVGYLRGYAYVFTYEHLTARAADPAAEAALSAICRSAPS